MEGEVSEPIAVDIAKRSRCAAAIDTDQLIATEPHADVREKDVLDVVLAEDDPAAKLVAVEGEEVRTAVAVDVAGCRRCRTLGLGAFDEENAPSFGRSAETKIRGARRENEILRQELAEFIDSSVLRVTKAMYRETLYAKGWKADQIDKALEEPSEQQAIRMYARKTAHVFREDLAAKTGIELPLRPDFWET